MKTTHRANTLLPIKVQGFTGETYCTILNIGFATHVRNIMKTTHRANTLLPIKVTLQFL